MNFGMVIHRRINWDIIIFQHNICFFLIFVWTSDFLIFAVMNVVILVYIIYFQEILIVWNHILLFFISRLFMHFLSAIHFVLFIYSNGMFLYVTYLLLSHMIYKIYLAKRENYTYISVNKTIFNNPKFGKSYTMFQSLLEYHKLGGWSILLSSKI